MAPLGPEPCCLELRKSPPARAAMARPLHRLPEPRQALPEPPALSAFSLALPTLRSVPLLPLTLLPPLAQLPAQVLGWMPQEAVAPPQRRAGVLLAKR